MHTLHYIAIFISNIIDIMEWIMEWNIEETGLRNFNFGFLKFLFII